MTKDHSEQSFTDTSSTSCPQSEHPALHLLRRHFESVYLNFISKLYWRAANTRDNIPSPLLFHLDIVAFVWLSSKSLEKFSFYLCQSSFLLNVPNNVCQCGCFSQSGVHKKVDLSPTLAESDPLDQSPPSYF